MENFRDDFLLLARTLDIIVFVETNSIQSISDQELGLNNYFVYRRDRYIDDNIFKGGKILIAVKKSFLSSIIIFDCNFDCEQ